MCSKITYVLNDSYYPDVSPTATIYVPACESACGFPICVLIYNILPSYESIATIVEDWICSIILKMRSLVKYLISFSVKSFYWGVFSSVYGWTFLLAWFGSKYPYALVFVPIFSLKIKVILIVSILGECVWCLSGIFFDMDQLFWL